MTTHCGKDVKLFIDGQEIQTFSDETVVATKNAIAVKPVSHIVYAIWDSELQEMHQFAASPNELAKDVVNAYIDKAINYEGFEESKKDIMTGISAATSIEDLTTILFRDGFHLNILAI